MRAVELIRAVVPVRSVRLPTRIWLGVLLLLALSAPSATIVPTETARAAALRQAPRTTPLAYGFQGDFFHTASRPQAIGAIKDAGFGWAKQQVRWSDYEIQSDDCAAAPEDCVTQSISGRAKYFRKRPLQFLDAVVND